MNTALNSIYNGTALGKGVTGLLRIKEILKYGDARSAVQSIRKGSSAAKVGSTETTSTGVEAMMIARFAFIGVGYILLFLLITL